MKLPRYLTMLFLTTCTVGLLAQSEQEIKEEYVKASDNMQFNYFDKALPSLHWLLKNKPDFSKNIQIWAIKALEETAKTIEDKERKGLLLDSMLIAFESKRTHFGLSDQDKNRLAFRYFKYFKHDKQKLAAGLDAFKSAFANPEQVVNNNLVPYMYMMLQYHKNIEELSQEEVINAYETIAQITSTRAKGPDESKMKDYMTTVDKMLVEIVGNPVPCNIVTQLAKGLERTDSVNVAKRVVSFSLDAKCGRTEEFMKSTEVLARNTPTPGILKTLAQYAAAGKEYDKAISLYEQAISIESDNGKKADISLDIANLHFLNKNKPEARKFALKVAQLDTDQAPIAYSFIGNLYMDSYDECAEGFNIIQDRAVFMAAYDMFKKANDKEGMENAFAQFPTAAQRHGQNMDEGEPIEVDCWINVKTVVRTRPSN